MNIQFISTAYNYLFVSFFEFLKHKNNIDEMCKITDRKYNICRRTELLAVSQSKQMASNIHKRYSVIVQIYFLNGNKNKPPNERVDKEM